MISSTPNGSLSVGHWLGGLWDTWEPLLEEKTGVELEGQNTPYNEYTQKLLTQLASGTAPDIISSWAGMNGEFFPSGLLAPVTDHMASSGIDMSKWNVDPMLGVGYGGELLGFPIFTSVDRIVHVNVELAEKDGLLADVPLWGTDRFDTWDWATFVDWVKAGTKITSDGTVEQYGVVVVNPPFKDMVSSLGGQLFDDEWNYDERESWLDTEPVVEALRLLTDLQLVHHVAPLPAAEAAMQGGNYLAGRALSTIQWASGSIYPEENSFPQEYFHLPPVDAKTHGEQPMYFSVNSASDKTDLAMEFLTTFCTDDDIRQLTFETSTNPPAYDPLPIIERGPESTGKKIALITLSRLAGMSSVPENTEGVVTFPGWFGRYASDFTQRAITTATEQVLLGESTVEEALAEAKQAVDAEITDAREREE